MDDPQASLVQNAAADHPGLVWVASVLFLAGLVADIWIVATWFRKRVGTEAASAPAIPPKPWGLAEVGLIVGMLCAAMVIGATAFQWLKRAGLLAGGKLKQAEMLAGGFVLDGLGLVAIFLLLHTLRLRMSEAFGIRPGSLARACGRGLFFLLAALPPVWLSAALSERVCQALRFPTEKQEVMQLFLESESDALRAAIMFMAVVMAPLFEEMFFRGLAYPALKRHIGATAALLVTSVGFAAIHLHPLSFLPLTVLAIGLTLAYEATGNLLVPIVMHSVFNLMTIVVMVMVST